MANQTRLWLFVLAYNLGNFMRRLVLPEDMKYWTLTSLQTRLIKTGGRLVRHARRLVFQLAEVLVTREILTGILERISRLRVAPDKPMAVIDSNDDICEASLTQRSGDSGRIGRFRAFTPVRGAT